MKQDDFLDSEQFYSIMQMFRNCSVHQANDAFDFVKQALRHNKERILDEKTEVEI